MGDRERTVIDELAARGHDLRTPLNTVVGYSELLLEDLELTDPDAIRADLRRIRDAGRQLLALVEDVLRVQRAESGRIPAREVCDVGALLQGVLGSMRAGLSAEGVRIEWSIAPDVRLTTSPDELSAIVRALVRRAVRAQATRVQLSLGVDGTHAVVTVADDGGRTVERSGMELAERTVALLGGTLRMSRGAEGTRVRVELPGVTREAPVTLDAYLDREVPVVLVVDDDDAMADLVRRHLAQTACEVVHASSGQAALRVARVVRPAVITLDVMMPELDGWDTLAQLRADPALCAIPVVMVSVLEDGQARGIGLGAAEYLQKPVERGALLSAVGRFLPRPRSRILVVDDEADARELARRLLVGAGHLVDEVTGGQQALDYLQAERPDLILLDLSMPEVDGFAVVKHLQADPRLSSIPLLVLTGMALSQEDRSRLGAVTQVILQKGDRGERVLQRIVDALDAGALSRRSEPAPRPPSPG